MHIFMSKQTCCKDLAFVKLFAQKQSKESDSPNPSGLRANSCTKLHSWAWGQAKSRRGFTTSPSTTGRTIFQSLLPSGPMKCHFPAPTSTLRRGEVGNNSPRFCREHLVSNAAGQLRARWHLGMLCPRSGTGSKDAAARCLPPRWHGTCTCHHACPAIEYPSKRG